MHETEQTYYKSLAKLGDKEKRFVSEYLVDSNAAKAARKAGYSSRCAKEIGYELLTKPHIAEAIRAGLDLIAERCQVDADKIVRELAAVAFASAHHYEVAEDGTLVVAEGAHPEAGLALQIKHRRITKADGNVEIETTYIQQDKVKALELLGKRLRMWVERVEVENPQDELYRELLRSLKEKQ